MAITLWEVDNTVVLWDVPGMLSLKRDQCGHGVYHPWPLDHGPICERCWINDGYVCPVGHSDCYHGGAPATEEVHS